MRYRNAVNDMGSFVQMTTRTSPQFFVGDVLDEKSTDTILCLKAVRELVSKHYRWKKKQKPILLQKFI